MPPQVQLTFENMGLPAINIPALPPGVTQQHLEQLIQQAVRQVAQPAIGAAADAAAQRFMKAQQQTGFQRIAYGTRWQQEA